MIRIVSVPEEVRTAVPTYPVHVAKGIESYFYEFALRRQDLQTTVAYLPVFWTSNYFIQRRRDGSDSLRAVERVQHLVNFLDNSPCFTILQADELYEQLPPSVLVFGAGGNGHIPIPLLTEPNVRQNHARDIFCSFAGAVEVGGAVRRRLNNSVSLWDANGPGARVRRKMVSLLSGLPDFEIQLRPWQNTPEWYESPYSRDTGEYVQSYRELLSRSVFTLCPRGYGLTSYRLYEAIQMGSIPVYISDDFWLPYCDKLDWSEFALVVPEEDLPRIPQLLRSLTQSRIGRMQERLVEVSATHFNLESACEWIVRGVNAVSAHHSVKVDNGNMIRQDAHALQGPSRM